MGTNADGFYLGDPERVVNVESGGQRGPSGEVWEWGEGRPALARIGSYDLLCWRVSCHIPTGRIGTAVVRLPSGKLGAFAVYELARQFAEWFPTQWLRKVRKSEFRELSEATPIVVELVKRVDPGAFIGSSRCRPKFAG